MSPLMTVGEFALATGLSAKAHAAELRRRRDLEDRALALAVAGVYAAPDPDDDGGPARPGSGRLPRMGAGDRPPRMPRPPASRPLTPRTAPRATP